MSKETGKRVFVSVEKTFDEPAETVFDAWLDVDQLGRWMFGPTVREEEIVSLTNDPRPGGRFSYRVRRAGTEIDHIGTYLEIERPRRLVFTWGAGIEPGDESIVTIRIEPSGGGCTLYLQHDMDIKWSEYAQRTEEGWTMMIGLLQERLHTW